VNHVFILPLVGFLFSLSLFFIVASFFKSLFLEEFLLFLASLFLPLGFLHQALSSSMTSDISDHMLVSGW